MCYTYPDSKMIATNPKTDGGLINIEYNTRLILTNDNCAMITGDIFKKLTESIGDGTKAEQKKFIKNLAQFRSINDYEKPIGNIDETKLNALFIYSSVIPGLKLEKILEQKKNFNKKISNKTIEDNRDEPFSYLAYHINKFYTAIKNIAISEVSEGPEPEKVTSIAEPEAETIEKVISERIEPE